MVDKKQDELDDALDAALAKYAAVEPRLGLENRVLANLKAERERVPVRQSWRWGLSGALAAVVVVSLTLAWRLDNFSRPPVANVVSTMQVPTHIETKATANHERNGVNTTGPKRASRVVAYHHHSAAVASNQPKLDQFPSPQPLSEQEKLLQNYVARYPEHAVLVARALTEALRPDQLKEVAAFPSRDGTEDSKDQNNDMRER